MSDLFVFSISVCFEACRGVQLDGGAADHFNAALLAFLTEGSDTTVHLSKKKKQSDVIHMDGRCLFMYCCFTIVNLRTQIVASFALTLTTWPNICISYLKSNECYSLCCLPSLEKLTLTPTGSFWLLEGVLGGLRGVLPFLETIHSCSAHTLLALALAFHYNKQGRC